MSIRVSVEINLSQDEEPTGVEKAVLAALGGLSSQEVAEQLEKHAAAAQEGSLPSGLATVKNETGRGEKMMSQEEYDKAAEKPKERKKPGPKPKTEKAPEPETAAEPEPEKTPEPEPAAETPDEAVSEEQARELAKGLMKEKRHGELKELLSEKFDGKRVSELDDEERVEFARLVGEL